MKKRNKREENLTGSLFSEIEELDDDGGGGHTAVGEKKLMVREARRREAGGIVKLCVRTVEAINGASHITKDHERQRNTNSLLAYLVVKADNGLDAGLLEVVEVVVGGVQGVAILHRRRGVGSSKGQHLARDDPVEVAIDNTLVVLVLSNVERGEVEEVVEHGLRR